MQEINLALFISEDELFAAYKALTVSLKANGFKFQNEGISSDRISSTYKRNRGGKIDYAETNEKSGGSFSSSFWFNYR